jgi:hypothetical protein
MERPAMPNFIDTKGRKWTVEINVAAIKRVRTLTGCDLLEAMEGKLIDRLMRDPVLLVDVLFALCKPQADEARITDEDFGEAMAGDCIEVATKAMLETLVSFCPNPRDRAALGRVLETTGRAMDKARDLVQERIDGGELDRIADEALALLKHGDSSTSVRE